MNDAMHKLDSHEPGTFLVRFSSNTNPHGFAISKVNSSNKVIHLRIQHKPGGAFTLADGNSYSSLPELVQPYSHFF
jgi:hypothetical protein